MFENLDVLKILGYGMSGFSFLLVLLTFFLLRAEQKREQEPRPLIIKMIWRFMLMTIFMVLVNGFISLPLFNQNAKLHESVTQLSNNSNEEITKEIAQNTDEIEDLISTPKTNEDSIQNAMQEIIDKQNKALDSIKATLTIANSTEERITEIDNLKQEMAVNYKVLLNPNVDKSTKMEANQNLKVLNTDLKRIAITPSK
ncbi:MAG: hypothetical protein CMP76_02770 [Flavobacterium sp.]|uniref:hypothetical protein n=1 Tax=Flavobacterium sp. TaxID=239 RepID=UPI000C570C89|nr:hypothetical protein [Flavobacterium sp.]MBF02199.1 hypothetical protein [Flavobacterium sp.]|tara:strand:- start:1257 stop:1853 length:597 start_codon:yes stop_codon:yes gene_type:complete